MMNIQELKVALNSCCGSKLNKGDMSCPKCRKRKRRIKNIDKEINKMWELHDKGILDRPYRKPKKKEYADKKD